MGLAEPRKRLKISHDPRNLSWSSNEQSYGQRLLLSQGWRKGEGLGVSQRSGGNGFVSEEGLKVAYKDDVLGVGANSNSKRPVSSTGLDAFVGVLGRLNGKSEEVVRNEAVRGKLDEYVLGRLRGGVLFVRGGVLVQGEGFRDGDVSEEKEEGEDKTTVSRQQAVAGTGVGKEEDTVTSEKDQKRRRKEERRKRKESLRTANGADAEEVVDSPTVRPMDTATKEKKKKKRKHIHDDVHQDRSTSHYATTTAEPQSSTSTETPIPDSQILTSPPQLPPAHRSATNNIHRQLLRGKNIQAKKLAFEDAKMLDEIFMRKQSQY